MKLTYFSGRGRAEVSRLILAYGNVDYENKRISYEDWPEIMPGTPYELLPILEVDDGVVIAESNAIARFLAKKVGLYANDAVTQAQIDMVVDNITNLDYACLKVTYPCNDEAMAADIKMVNEEKIPRFIRCAEKLLVARGGKYFAGNKLSLADIAMFNVLSSLTDPTDPILTKLMKNRLGESRLECLDNAPNLKAHMKMVGEVPAIKKWIETRPGNDKEEF